MSERCDESYYKLLGTTDLCHTTNRQYALMINHPRNATTGLLHCVMTRTKVMPRALIQSNPSMYDFYIEIPAASGGTFIQQLILTGVKESGHSYSIYSIPADTSVTRGTKLGSLERVQINMYSISYVVKNAANVSIAYIVYRVPSPIQVVRDPPSRFAQFAVHAPTPKSDTNDESHHHDSTETMKLNNKQLFSSYFDKVCMYSISRHHNLSGVMAIQDDDPSIHVLQSNVPYIHSTSGRATLNFRSRGKYASPKNMQLMSTSPQRVIQTTTTVTHQCVIHPLDTDHADPDDIVTPMSMQMCKWDHDTYHVDFDVSHCCITHLHAFAFGLAQMDI